ncbi:MAG: RsmB/NOP family class I SAM-dependent RNA methyltransferase, partial [Chlamydiales bacterium]|nr:RsmB/NOP family class I SAM-dependent RNA methyltransferase [Chlamydiales bacterium]
ALYEERSSPLDLLLKNYFKSNRAVGSKDRKEICERLYTLIRWQGLIDHFCKKPITWKSRYTACLELNPLKHLDDPHIPPHVRISFPKSFFQLLETSLGRDLAWDFCQVSNQTAPTTVRINPAKTTREALLKKWEGTFDVRPSPKSPWGITFQKKENFFSLPEFKEGLFEVQDEASQLIADLVSLQGDEQVLDYCAGSGGKTLAFAHKLAGKGQIYLHDIRPHALQEAKKRLKRAGVQNAQILLPDSAQKARLKGKMDRVIVDAPCSGTGTLRRNPDMKWKFDIDMIPRLASLQKEIVQEALSFLKPGGELVYATCSVLPQENEEQLLFFQKELSLELCCPILKTFPRTGEMDGFFGAVLRKRN